MKQLNALTLRFAENYTAQLVYNIMPVLSAIYRGKIFGIIFTLIFHLSTNGATFAKIEC